MAEWTREQAEFLGRVNEVRIAPLREDGTAWPGRLIWVLEVDGRVWARSWKGANTEWFERAMLTHLARVTVEEGDSGFDAAVTLRPDQDAVVAAAIDAEFLRKYGEPYATEMTLPLAAETTVELIPILGG